MSHLRQNKEQNVFDTNSKQIFIKPMYGHYRVKIEHLLADSSFSKQSNHINHTDVVVKCANERCAVWLWRHQKM